LLAHSQLEAQTDLLTGLGNRRRLMRDLETAFAGGTTFSVAVLDGFKLYNDQFGHAEGDLMLARLGRRIASVVGGHGAAYRLGGDEFCVVARDGEASAAVHEAARAALEESGREFDISCSCGVAEVPAEAADADGALRLAGGRR